MSRAKNIICIVLMLFILALCLFTIVRVNSRFARETGRDPTGGGIDPGRITAIEDAVDTVGERVGGLAESVNDSGIRINRSVSDVGEIRSGLDIITARLAEAQGRVERIEESCGRIEQLIEEIKAGGNYLEGDSHR
jgi:hypothetical protein